MRPQNRSTVHYATQNRFEGRIVTTDLVSSFPVLAPKFRGHFAIMRSHMRPQNLLWSFIFEIFKLDPILLKYLSWTILNLFSDIFRVRERVLEGESDLHQISLQFSLKTLKIIKRGT